ncbi:hypothetical protein ACHAXA_006321 [Cyclostephanos tholiformis]|uniref:Uncharacterized protein n=1 Tax=Cyclostephanos tholiformis TaxID=382380 RepID=A0ABD3R5T4_9STRA
MSASTGLVQSKLHLDCNLSAPMFSMLSFYVPLSIICIGLLMRDERRRNNKVQLYSSTPSSDNSYDGAPSIYQQEQQRRRRRRRIRENFQSTASSNNYTTILAYKYTTITNVALFDAFSIPSAIVVSRCFFGRRYTGVHLLAVVACVIGIALNVIQDYMDDERVATEDASQETEQEQYIAKEYPHKMAGDALAIIGGILFGISNTLQEVTVKDGSLMEYLGCFTFFASIIASIQAMFFERQEIMAFYGKSSDETCSKSEGEFLFFLFAIAGMVTYAGIGAFLQFSDAAFFNLSLLTGDAWAVIFSVFAEGIKPPPTFYIALAITLSGVIIYETAPSPVVDPQQEDIGDLQLTENINTGTRDQSVRDNLVLT